MEVEIKKLGNEDIEQFKELIRVFENVFEMENFTMVPDSHLQQLLQKKEFMVFIALSENQVVGGLTAYTLQQYYSTSSLVYVYDLAVKNELQRKGIGKKLMQAITAYCKKNGIREVFVQADAADDYALDFYRSTGARAEKVVHFTYPLNTRAIGF